jgi:hypothetical protein
MHITAFDARRVFRPVLPSCRAGTRPQALTSPVCRTRPETFPASAEPSSRQAGTAPNPPCFFQAKCVRATPSNHAGLLSPARQLYDRARRVMPDAQAVGILGGRASVAPARWLAWGVAPCQDEVRIISSRQAHITEGRTFSPQYAAVTASGGRQSGLRQLAPQKHSEDQTSLSDSCSTSQKPSY